MSQEKNASWLPWVVVVVVVVVAAGVFISDQLRDVGETAETIRPFEALDYCSPERLANDDEVMTASFQVKLMARQTGANQAMTASLYQRVLSTSQSTELDNKLSALDQAIDESLETGDWDAPMLLAADIDEKTDEYCKT